MGVVKIIGSGCSFTHDPNISWLYQLKNYGFDIHNYSQGSGGNQLSTRILIHNIPKYHDDDIIVVRQLSSPHRASFIVEEGDVGFDEKLWDFMLSQTHDWLRQSSYYGISNLDEGDWNNRKIKSYWTKIQPLDFIDEKNIDKDLSLDMIKKYYSYFGGHYNMIYQTLESILYLQTYCNSKNIPHIQFFGWDSFCGFEHYLEYEDCLNLMKQIDWSKIINIDWKIKNQKGKFGGINEWALMNLPLDKCFNEEIIKTKYSARVWAHPSEESHRLFVDDFLLEKIKTYI